MLRLLRAVTSVVAKIERIKPAGQTGIRRPFEARNPASELASNPGRANRDTLGGLARHRTTRLVARRGPPGQRTTPAMCDPGKIIAALDIMTWMPGIGDYEKAFPRTQIFQLVDVTIRALDLNALLAAKEAIADPDPRKQSTLQYLKELRRLKAETD